MNINMDSIMGKVESWSESAEGKRRIQQVLDQYKKDGRTVTAAGSRVISEKMMLEAVVKFIDVLKSTAAEYGLPKSVMEHIDGMSSSGHITKTSKGFEVYLYFSGDLSRESLEATEEDADYWASRGFGGHTGEGIKNIVALFNNGYSKETIGSVYGVWKNAGKETYNTTERKPLRFIQKAVVNFNINYGYEYGVTAVAGADYE